MAAHPQNAMAPHQQFDVTGAPVHNSGDPYGTGPAAHHGGAPDHYGGGAPAHHGGPPAHDAVAPAHHGSPAGAGHVTGSETDRLKEKFHHATGPANKGDAPWSTSFWSCFSPADLCCITCCCPCITFGKTHHRLEHNGDMTGYSPINLPCVAFCGAMYVGLFWIGNMLQRADIRQRSNPKLSGDVATDCLRGFCCGCCDLMQQERESEALLARHSAVSHQPPKQDGMNYHPPTQ